MSQIDRIIRDHAMQNGNNSIWTCKCNYILGNAIGWNIFFIPVTPFLCFGVVYHGCNPYFVMLYCRWHYKSCESFKSSKAVNIDILTDWKNHVLWCIIIGVPADGLRLLGTGVSVRQFMAKFVTSRPIYLETVCLRLNIVEQYSNHLNAVICVVQDTDKQILTGCHCTHLLLSQRVWW